MTPEERQLLTALADRIKAAPNQQRDQEADEFLRQLVQQRPDTAYLLAQTVLMQDFALRNAQTELADLRRQLDDAKHAQPAQGSGSFLGGLFGGASPPPPRPAPGAYRAPGPSSVPPTRSAPLPNYGGPSYAGPAPAAPMLQPAQTSGFLQQAATTAVGIAGGALLFEGIQSLFGPHYGAWAGVPMVGVGGPWGGPGWVPPESLTETTIVNNNYYGDQQQDLTPDHQADDQPDPNDQGTDQGSGYQDIDTDGDPGGSDGGDFGGNDDGLF
jgi:hypothetical protein